MRFHSTILLKVAFTESRPTKPMSPSEPAYPSYFSADYGMARSRFRAAVKALGYAQTAYGIPVGTDPTVPRMDWSDLTIDVAIGGAVTPRHTVVISSGLHGVEGFLGSAIQLALCQSHLTHHPLPDDLRLVLIHALNPYGFAARRRWNEANIDLNRNFLLPGELFQGSPPAYPRLDAFLNPPTPPSQWEPYGLKAIALILRHGMTTLRHTLPVGQYDFPKGLFWGGDQPSQTQRILSQHLPDWVGSAPRVTHLDLHSGLGQWGTYRLFANQTVARDYALFSERFGHDRIELPGTAQVAYAIRGGLGEWCQAQCPQSNYGFFIAEFGTYTTIRAIQVLRAENQAHWWGKAGQSYEWTKRQLVEMFAPRSLQWRSRCVAQGVEICRKALA